MTSWDGWFGVKTVGTYTSFARGKTEKTATPNSNGERATPKKRIRMIPERGRNPMGTLGRLKLSLLPAHKFSFIPAHPFSPFVRDHLCCFRRKRALSEPSTCKLMGHSNILVSQRYVHPTHERVETAFAGLDAYNQERARAAKE